MSGREQSGSTIWRGDRGSEGRGGRGGREEGRGGRGGREEGRGGRGGREEGRGGRGGREEGRGGRGERGGERGAGGYGGGRGRGSISHAGQLAEISSLLSSREMIPQPYLLSRAPDVDRIQRPVSAPTLPSQQSSRWNMSVGARLPKKVVTNHFRVDESKFPTSIDQYRVDIYPWKKGAFGESMVAKITSAISYGLIDKFLSSQPAFRRVVYLYDGRSYLCTPTDAKKAIDTVFEDENVTLTDATGTTISGRFKIVIKLTNRITGEEVVKALNLFALSYARRQGLSDKPTYYESNTAVYSVRDAERRSVRDMPGFELFRGILFGMKRCSLGTAVIFDLTVDVFLCGGPLIEVMKRIWNMNRIDPNTTITPVMIQLAKRAISKLKVDITHLHHSNKMVNDIGPIANDPKSAFLCEECGNRQVTIAEYFAFKSTVDPRRYKKLQYPKLPTVQIGKAYYPMEFLYLRAGQTNRIVKNLPEVKAQLVTFAVISCQERYTRIVNNDFLALLGTHHEANEFGLSSIIPRPIEVPAMLLPPPTIAYSPNDHVQPGLEGAWNPHRDKIAQTALVAPLPDKKYHFLPLVLGKPPTVSMDWQGPVNSFLTTFLTSRKLPLTQVGTPLYFSEEEAFLKSPPLAPSSRISFVLVILLDDSLHATVKQVYDPQRIVSQCCRYSNIEKTFIASVLVDKLIMKMGGSKYRLLTNPVAATATPPATPATPPALWKGILLKPTMLMGIDVSHPGRDTLQQSSKQPPSIAAVVGTIDPYFTQYGSYLSIQETAGQEMVVQKLVLAMVSLLDAFKNKQGVYPSQVIVFRDGVSESQYEQVCEQEVIKLQQALAERGLVETKLVVVVCTKRHATRFFYPQTETITEEAAGMMINLSPGTVIDNRLEPSVVHEHFNEFYLQSHVALLGTAKACRYTIVYDEIGLLMSELELLTYWTTFTFARCNRSVSYATPAYYAHLLSLRGKELMQQRGSSGSSSTSSAGSTSSGGGPNLDNLSLGWLRGNNPMYFI